MLIPSDLLTRWIKRRDELQKLNASVDGAILCNEVLDDLESLAQSESERTLTLAEASDMSGYSTDHLSRLLREGKIPNIGRKGAPRIRLADLPRRPRKPLASRESRAYDPDADARSIRSRLGEC